MLRALILCSILSTTSVYGSNSTLVNIEPTYNITNKKESKEGNKTIVTLVSEGGSIVTEAAPLTLPTRKLTLLNLDKELDKVEEKKNPVVARKGVNDSLDDNIPMKSNFSVVKEHLENNSKYKFSNNHTDENKSEIEHNFNSSFIQESSNRVDKNKTMKSHKPTILSADAVNDIDNNIDDIANLNIPAVKSSFRTVISDQISSPHKENSVNLYSLNKHGHPGMIMPIVITIFVVPMFALLGYLALKRGQEAWKNRHYKRMDFLLDGMYND